MNRKDILEDFCRQPCGTLLMAGELYREKYAADMSEAAFAQAVSRLCRDGKIERISKGIYCRPKMTRFGAVLPSEQEIVNLFTEGTKGVVVGYGLYNELGISTQISKCQLVYSSLSEEQVKKIGGVTIRKYDLIYTPEVKNTIQLMELLYHFGDIQDMNLESMLRITKKFAGEYRDDVFSVVQETIGYPKWTVAFLRELLNYYQTANRLNAYLSSLSKYMIPKMEDLYEIARKSG